MRQILYFSSSTSPCSLILCAASTFGNALGVSDRARLEFREGRPDGRWRSERIGCFHNFTIKKCSAAQVYGNVYTPCRRLFSGNNGSENTSVHVEVLPFWMTAHGVDVDAVEQPVELLGCEFDHRRLSVPGPGELVRLESFQHDSSSTTAPLGSVADGRSGVDRGEGRDGSRCCVASKVGGPVRPPGPMPERRHRS